MIKEKVEIPYSQEAEMSVLGAMILSEQALAIGLEKLRADDFYIDAHKKIFLVLEDIFEKKRTLDVITVKNELERRGLLEQVGGPQYLATLIENVISPALIDAHAKIVLEKSIYRKIIDITTQILKEAYEGALPADELLDRAEQHILNIREREVREGFRPMRDMVVEYIGVIEQLRGQRTGITGIPSGYPSLDELTSGFQKGDLIIIASRPSQGKTSFALNVLRYLGVEKEIPAAFFSLEMSKEQLVMRLLCMEAKVSIQKVRKGRISDEDMEKLTYAAGKLKKAPIFIDDTAAIPIIELRAKARRIAKEQKIKLIVVDYLQLVRGPENVDNRQQEISAISRSLKALAKELNIPVIAISQLSRAVEQRASKRPQLSDLRESGAIEQDADVVIFIHRPHKDDEEAARKPGEEIEIIIGKQRNGPIGTIKLVFLKDYTRFEERSYEEEIDEYFEIP